MFVDGIRGDRAQIAIVHHRKVIHQFTVRLELPRLTLLTDRQVYTYGQDSESLKSHHQMSTLLGRLPMC